MLFPLSLLFLQTNEGYEFSLIKYLIVTLFVIGLAYLFIIFLKFTGYKPKESNIKLKEKKIVSADKYITIVEIHGINYIILNSKAQSILLDKRTDIEYPKNDDTSDINKYDALNKFVFKRKLKK
jgi:hypothetical protein